MPLQFFPPPQEDEQKIREAVRRVADRVLRPHAVENDERAVFRRESFDAFAKERLHAVGVAKEWGGGGMSARCYYAMLEEISRAEMATAITVGVTNLVQGGINAFGTPGQKENFLRPLVEGKWIGAFSLSEPHAGSDAASLSLKVTKAPGGYSLSGTKVWCSTAGEADLYLVMGRTGPGKSGITSFLVEKEAKGFRIGKMEKKLGLKASPLAELVFEDCFVPESQRLGKEGEGLAVALSQLDAGRITIGAAGVGAAIEVIERVWKLRPDLEEGEKHILAEHYAYAAAVRSLITQAAILRDQKGPLTAIASQVKLLGSDLAVRASSDAISLLGAVGARRELEVERYLRDSKALQIVEGTNQIQRLVLAREIGEMMQ